MDTNTVTPAKSGMSTTKKVLIGFGLVLGTFFVIGSVMPNLANTEPTPAPAAVVEPAVDTQPEYPNQYRGVAQLAWDNLTASDRQAICEAHNIDAQYTETMMLESMEAEGLYDAGFQADVVQVLRTTC